MNIKFHTLTLQCKKSREIIEFSPHISFIHGKISSGKSSIARLVDFCLGGELEHTPAIQTELVSVVLSATIGNNEVLFERETGFNKIQVSWKNNDGDMGSVLAPIQNLSAPIWGDSVFNISDMIFYLLNITPLKVRRSKNQSDSPLVRLSFKDVRWYCYLDQDNLDSSFYRLEDAFKKLKSRDVMRFMVGYYTEQLNKLEIQLDELKDERKSKLGAIGQVTEFLKEFNYDSEAQINEVIERHKAELEDAKSQLKSIQNTHRSETHFVDNLRQQLRELNKTLGKEEEALFDLKSQLNIEKSLKAEILSTKFKLAKATEASLILSGVSFECCPNCGSDITPQPINHEQCPLCKHTSSKTDQPSANQSEMIRKDLTSRLNDITESIERHSWALKIQERRVQAQCNDKSLLDKRLMEELVVYDSSYLSHARETERRVAMLEERIRGIEKIASIANTINKLQEEADEIHLVVERIKREIEDETKNFTTARDYITDIENTYLEFLNQVGVPGVTEEDEVHIDLKTWLPSIQAGGDQALTYTFYNAGSGGKKTLLNVCYALSVHKVAAENNLPLPTYL
ncbi:MAG: hypothetical protein KAJ40_03645, partial [Alphaproteobacteria bacterium]|nr:hypothetical protein [Alphaproteobacteria bacterium]